MTKKPLTTDVLEDTATTLAKKKLSTEPERFAKIADPQARLATARREVYVKDHPELAGLHAQLNAERSASA